MRSPISGNRAGCPVFGKICACTGFAVVFYQVNVKFWSQAMLHTLRGRIVVSVMLLLWLGTFVAAGSPEIHRLLHADSHSTSHHCVLTQVQEHLLLAVLQTVGVPTPVLMEAGFTPLHQFEVSSIDDCRLPPGRAPPRFTSSIPVVGVRGG
jgi:hypothetical protein